jgi:hypothetical protein
MAQSSSKAELRKFGLTVGLAFAAFGTVSWWRGHELPPKVLWTLGVLLVVPGLVAPAILAPVRRAWMAFAAVLGHVNTRIILSILFYLVLTPIGFVLRLFRDPMQRSLADRSGSQWIKRKLEPVDPASYERQF